MRCLYSPLVKSKGLFHIPNKHMEGEESRISSGLRLYLHLMAGGISIIGRNSDGKN